MVELLIIDSVIPDYSRNRPHAGKLLDINILAMTTGQERTLSEFKTIIERAGLKFNRLIETETETEISSIIECGRY
ncbi:methyltransferase [Sphingobacterium athyrii]|nr:methyltransferase [Sphingobacterium athyrii]